MEVHLDSKTTDETCWSRRTPKVACTLHIYQMLIKPNIHSIYNLLAPYVAHQPVRNLVIHVLSYIGLELVVETNMQPSHQNELQRKHHHILNLVKEIIGEIVLINQTFHSSKSSLFLEPSRF